MWRERKSFDYKFVDQRITEMYSIGGVGMHLHRYLGAADTGPSTDATKPQITDQNRTERSIQDLLFMENRDRKYDTTIYNLRGIYTKADQDFDLSQFGLFLSNGTIFVTFPLNDMVRIVGRKIMAGDVLELQNLQDDYADVNDVPVALKRYYVVGDCSWPSEGFSPLWYPHLWRAKISPLVDSQEYKSILNSLKVGNTNTPIISVLSQFNKLAEINAAVVAQAEHDVPQSGYDVSMLHTKPDSTATNIYQSIYVEDGYVIDDYVRGPWGPPTPELDDNRGYLTGDGLAPNGYPVTTGISFPTSADIGQYFLRLDYLPNRLFRYTGSRWIMVEDAVRTGLNRDSTNKSLKNSFINNTNTYTDEAREVHPELQNLHDILKAKPGQ